ncbi:putative transposase [Ixodes scapularis]
MPFLSLASFCEAQSRREPAAVPSALSWQPTTNRDGQGAASTMSKLPARIPSSAKVLGSPDDVENVPPAPSLPWTKAAGNDDRSQGTSCAAVAAANPLAKALSEMTLKQRELFGETEQDLGRGVAASSPTPWTPYADIVLELTAHFTPCLSVIVQCFAFHKCSQQPGESISNFVPAPRRFSEHCNFGETLSAMLWDRLVCGVLDKRVQRRPLGKPVLELKKAFEAADPLPL